MKRPAALLCAMGVGIGAALVMAADQKAAPASEKPDKPATTQPAQIKLDMDQAVALDLPKGGDLSPREFHSKDGRSGWVVQIPGGRPIATPAYADGLLFVGGGYGSHEFYAFDAQSGKKVWQINTADDGPTAAVVEDGCVAFNTESCTVIVVEAKTGKLLWQEWLGDPLMSQPAISRGKLYMAYPGGQPRGPNGSANANGVGPAKGHGHRLLCADLKTGKHLWEQDITADVISAPIVEGDQVFFTCFDGTSFALDCSDGKIAWQKHNSGTSAPLVAGNQVLLTERENAGAEVKEGLQRLDRAKGEAQEKTLLAAGNAEYLKKGHEGAVALGKPAQAQLDSSVGFASAPASAALGGAEANANVSTVAAGWAYQGSRAAYANGQILNAQANMLNCVRAKDGQVAWQARAYGKGVDQNVQAFSPPAVAGGNLFICSAQGHLMELSQKDGKVGFIYSTGMPMAFQPALADGNMYAGTANGALICLKTGDKTADGWTAWGGNAQHNKKE